jgi:hypothetical protein
MLYKRNFNKIFLKQILNLIINKNSWFLKYWKINFSIALLRFKACRKIYRLAITFIFKNGNEEMFFFYYT